MKDLSFLGKLFGADVLGNSFVQRRDGWVRKFELHNIKELGKVLESFLEPYRKFPVFPKLIEIEPQELTAKEPEVIRTELDRIEIKVFYKEV